MNHYEVKFIIKEKIITKIFKCNSINEVINKLGWYVLNEYRVKKVKKIISIIDINYI